jgi:2-methylcitrate dehydratase PrpD
MATPAKIAMPSPPAAVTAGVVDRVNELISRPLPDDIRLLARQCVLDWMGCAIAGCREPLSEMLLAQALEDGGRPVANVIGHSDRVSARQAALLNGAYGHAIDYDDVGAALGGHPTAAILPAALAAAQAEGADGERLLRAFVAGYEGGSMVGLLVAPGHYARGFHATGTVGAIGAAIAAATLMGLDAEATARAIGIAATQAAGLKSQFGTMCKPLHAGKASENGLVAAQLARRGFTSRLDILECEQGFSVTLSPDFNPQAAFAPPAGDFHIRANLFKYNAACYGTHGAIEASRALAREHAIDPAQISRIEVRAEQATERMCNIIGPRTGLEGKFSLRFNTAFAVAGGDTSSPDVYSERTVTRPDLVELQKRVNVVFMPAGWPRMNTEVEIRLSDGRVLTRRHDVSRPATDLHEQGARLLQKFQGLAEPAIGHANARALASAVAALESVTDLGNLLALAR